MEWTKGPYRISDDRSELDLFFIASALQRSYWAADRPREIVEQSLDNSLCFGLYQGDRQLGFARVVTDKVTFAWICDVIVDEDQRGVGLGKWLMECLEEHPGPGQVAHGVPGGASGREGRRPATVAHPRRPRPLRAVRLQRV